MLIGLGTADDAGVYRVNDEIALIQTVDFFTPIVDDPYDFGRIAAANSLSDVYAMGGTPQTAMNIVAFPIKQMGAGALKDMLAGGADILREANTVLLGGHSVEDDELKYGMSITGFVHPDKILANQGLRDGDCLILTKPIGTGIINTAIKAGLASNETIRAITTSMACLNKAAAEVIAGFNISACTDITGFGLLGHIAEMVDDDNCEVHIVSNDVPKIAESYEFAAMGFVPTAAYNNWQFRNDLIQMPDSYDPIMRDIMFDPQTSGGLLFGCLEKDVPAILKRLTDNGLESSAVIGYVKKSSKSMVIL